MKQLIVLALIAFSFGLSDVARAAPALARAPRLSLREHILRGALALGLACSGVGCASHGGLSRSDLGTGSLSDYTSNKGAPPKLDFDNGNPLNRPSPTRAIKDYSEDLADWSAR
jgi:hypothetical protein